MRPYVRLLSRLVFTVDTRTYGCISRDARHRRAGIDELAVLGRDADY